MACQNQEVRMDCLQLQKSVQPGKFQESQYGGLRVIKHQKGFDNSESNTKT